MDQTTKRPAGVDNGAPQEVCGPETTVAGTADNPWYAVDEFADVPNSLTLSWAEREEYGRRLAKAGWSA